MPKVKLTDIQDALEFQSDENAAMINLKTGEVCTISDECLNIVEGEEDDYPEWMEDEIKIAKQYMDNRDQFIDLPGKYDINEYSMMEDFALECADENKRALLLCALNGKGAFRRFKDVVYELGIEKDWFQFRDEKYIAFILDWCEINEIEVEI